MKPFLGARAAAVLYALSPLLGPLPLALAEKEAAKPAAEASEEPVAPPAAPIEKPPLCLPDKSLCQDDYAYGRSRGNPLAFGRVESISGFGKDTRIRIDGAEFSADNIARVKTDQCARDALGARLCPGNPVQKDGKPGVVLAVFPNGYVVVTQPGEPPFSQPGETFSRYEADCEETPELRELIKDYPFIQNALVVPGAGTCELSFKAHPRYPELAQRNPKIKNPSIDCDEKSTPIQAENSPNLDHFIKLLKSGMKAPLKDFLKLWYPERKRIGKKGDENDTILKCQQNKAQPGYTTSGGAIPEPCAPDVLYSWGPKEKVETLAEAMSDGKKWRGSPNPKAKVRSGILFASNSAVSTYMYGPVGVRIKLKPKTPFPVLEFGGVERAVGYRDSYYQDFGISDSSVIESWSYGTPEHYDEIVRDLQRISSGKAATLYRAAPLNSTGLSRIYDIGPIDSRDNNETTLKANLLEMIRMILAGEGRIHYSKGACRNRAEHFLTDKPSYINP